MQEGCENTLRELELKRGGKGGGIQYLPSKSAGPIPIIIIDIGREAALTNKK